MNAVPAITLDHFTDSDRHAMRELLDGIIALDYPCEEKIELRQGGFTLWVKTENKPGVDAMERFCRLYTESPGQLCLILRKLLGDNTGAER